MTGDDTWLQPPYAPTRDVRLSADPAVRRRDQPAPSVGEVSYNGFLLKLAVGEHLLTVFPDGRAIVQARRALEEKAEHVGSLKHSEGENND